MKHPFVLYHALCGVLPVGAVMCLIGPLVSGRSYYCAKRHTLYVEPMLISQTFISDSWSTEKTQNKFHIQIHCKQTYILYKSTIRRHGFKRIRISRCPTKKQLYQCLHNWNWQPVVLNLMLDKPKRMSVSVLVFNIVQFISNNIHICQQWRYLLLKMKGLLLSVT